ncbi:unnamed protein product [Ilex paraguariensis]|uniref:WRKY domain-containing protein n=1 Tax=Ilex paraguariensis TaxID=185542 RepID=A0ABC8UBB8_9AQUA
MENYQGDLADMLRASGGAISGYIDNNSGQVQAVNDWQFRSDPMSYPSGIEEPSDYFGNPFSIIKDPLLHEIDFPNPGLFNNSISSKCMMKTGVSVEGAGGCGGGRGDGVSFAQKIPDEEMQRPCNIFSRMLQISPTAKLPVSPCDSPVVVAASPRVLKPTSLVSNGTTSRSSSKGYLVETSGVQVSSPRNTVIKRRKSQAKKVVCIPAPSPVNSRPSSGEIVPSDLWAWRKYGQKPIKGSPYPRGYYRCSSSKGCSARKQVERSRNDPNMLVITYTSEHNHPWPTQRNALAGSTRSQPSKKNSTSKNSPASQPQKTTSSKEEQKETNTESDNLSILTGNSKTRQHVKEEMEEDLDYQIDMDDSEFNEGFPPIYRPALPESNHSEDFFADLGEIEADPINLLFTRGFSGDERENSKGSDPFGLGYWIGNNNSTSFGEA